MTILVTGGRGNIGSRVIARLAAAWHRQHLAKPGIHAMCEARREPLGSSCRFRAVDICADHVGGRAQICLIWRNPLP